MSIGTIAGRRLAAIMFADIVGYTEMMQADESAARDVCTRFRASLQATVERHVGHTVQFYGDGALTVFESAKEAVLAATALQVSALADPSVPLRIGMHVGDVVIDESGVYGDGVNIAARIESMAIPGAVLLSDKLREEIDNHADVHTVALGEYDLKKVRRPVKVFAVRDDRIIVPSPGEIRADAKASARKSIAVLPFGALHQNEETAYFADGLSQEITNGLSKVKGLSIIARSTCLAIQAMDAGPIEIGRRLNVRNILEGSVRRAGSQVRVSVQLVNTADGSQVWSETYDRTLDRVFEVQDEIAQLVVNGLRLRFDAESKNRPIIEKATGNVEAYGLYLKGLHHWSSRTPESGQKAVGLLESALELDSEFSPAECMLSQCYAYLGSCGALPPMEAYAKALDHATGAIERDPTMPEAHLALAVLKFYHLWDWRGTRVSLDKAEALGLDSADFHEVYGFYLAAIGAPEQGVPRLRRAVELNPLSVPTIHALAALQFFCGRHAEALSLYEEIIELNPAFRGAYQLKGLALLMLGRSDEALPVLEDYHARVGHPLKGLTCLTLAYHRLGYPDRVADCLERMYRRLDEESSVAAEVDLALVTAGLGRYDDAIEHLDSVYDQRYSIACTGMIWILRCSIFSELWEQPGYRKLLDRMGLER